MELLMIDGCSHATAAERLFSEALHEAGPPDQEVLDLTLRTQAEARATAFAESPTFTVDLTFPIERSGSDNGLSCREYPTSDGLQGLPN